jgi:transcription antitermination factor NusG
MIKRWFALQVHAGREKWIASYLEDLGFEHLLLVRREMRRWSDRFKTIEKPIFTGYVFCRFHFEDRVKLLSGPGVLRIVGYGRTPMPVDDHEMAAVQTLSTTELPLRECPYLNEGDFVRLEGGSLDGLVGRFVEARAGARVVVSVTILQRSVAVEIDRSRLTAIQSVANPSISRKHAMAGSDPERFLGQRTVA